MLPIVWACHAGRPASHLWRSSPALYHQLVLSAPAPARFRSRPRPFSFHSRPDATKVPLRGGRLRGHARTHSSTHHGTGGRESFHRHASAEAAHGKSLASETKRRDPRQRQLFLEGPERSFWQARFYDFNVWSEKKRFEKLRYMHSNPVKRGLVDSPEQWRWSSDRYYDFGEAGPVRVNVGWGAISFRDRAA